MLKGWTWRTTKGITVCWYPNITLIMHIFLFECILNRDFDEPCSGNMHTPPRVSG